MAQLRTLPPRLTPEEYLEGEKIAEVRHEFVDGFVYAMVGTTLRHSDIKLNITAWLRGKIPDGCGMYNGDVKLMVKAVSDTAFYYPDVFVSCGRRSPEDHYLRVHTDAGEELLTMRFADAVKELARAHGFQTHRSWWVAADAVESVRWRQGVGEARLAGGLTAPVSRTHAPTLKAAGWF